MIPGLIDQETSEFLRVDVPQGLTWGLPAHRVVEALMAGKNINITNAVITGPFVLGPLTVTGAVTIEHTTFADTFDCSYSTFTRVLRLRGSTFARAVSFREARSEQPIVLRECNFKEGATFTGAQINGSLTLREAVFEGEVSFNRTVVRGSAYFNYATFRREANFVNLQVTGDAEFTQVTFLNQVRFSGARVNGLADFDRLICVEGAEFTGCQFLGGATFQGATIGGKANFNGISVGHLLIFNIAIFRGDASFVSAEISGNAQFPGVRFCGTANFNGSRVTGRLFLNKSVFVGDAYFIGAHYVDAEYQGAEFRQDAYFHGTRFDGPVYFNPVRFDGLTVLAATRVLGPMYLERALFGGHVSFEDAEFRVLDFGQPEEPNYEQTAEFRATIDLRGCTYSRIHPTSFWRTLVRCAKPYDRQVYVQLEDTFRRSGEDGLADSVYFMRRASERARRGWLSLFRWWDVFLGLATGYGLRLYRVAFAVAIILAAGTLFFVHEGTVIGISTGDTPNVAAPEEQLRQEMLGVWEAFWVSVDLFLPVDVPGAGRWHPSTSVVWGLTPTTFARLLTVAGWFLVPLSIAGVTGLLKRR